MTQLRELIKETLLSSHGLRSDLRHVSLSTACVDDLIHVRLSPLSADTEFGLSLGGSELLSDSEQTLASCGVVSGDLICVLLPAAAASNPTTAASNPTTAASNPTTATTRTTQSQQINSGTTSQVSSEDILTVKIHIFVAFPTVNMNHVQTIMFIEY